MRLAERVAASVPLSETEPDDDAAIVCVAEAMMDPVTEAVCDGPLTDTLGAVWVTETVGPDAVGELLPVGPLADCVTVGAVSEVDADAVSVAVVEGDGVGGGLTVRLEVCVVDAEAVADVVSVTVDVVVGVGGGVTVGVTDADSVSVALLDCDTDPLADKEVETV